MTLLDFILVCKLKGMVQHHSELPTCNGPCTKFYIRIATESHSAVIQYYQSKGETIILSAMLIERISSGNIVDDSASLEKIITAILMRD